jgi:hypothetical protein
VSFYNKFHKPEWANCKKCIDCQKPLTDHFKREVAKYIHSCRDCKHAVILRCEDCGEEMIYCKGFDQPPSKFVDRKNCCLKFKEKEDADSGSDKEG